jgi:flagellar motor switch protein FliN/FliY
MSPLSTRVDAAESTRELLSTFTKSLAEVLQTMTDRRPEVAWEAVEGEWTDVCPSDNAGFLWWAQEFQAIPETAVWVGAPQVTWEELGSRTLRAAGLESFEQSEVRQTWMEILSQVLSALARATGSYLRTEVSCTTGSEMAPPAQTAHWARVGFARENDLKPIWITFSSALMERLTSPEPVSAVAPAASASSAAEEELLRRPPVYGRTMDLLLDVELPVSISFGRTQIPLKDVLKLTTGSIVELNRNVSEAVEVLVNHSLIARGEVVVVEGNYGVRIQEVLSPQDRLRAMR